MSVNNIALLKLSRFREGTVAGYTADTQKMAAFNEAMDFLLAMPKIGFGEGGFSCENDDFKFCVDYGANQGLLIILKKSGVREQVFVRELKEAMARLLDPRTTDSLFCRQCNKTHTRLGLEFEFNGLVDKDCRNVLLRALNKTPHIDTSIMSFGIDGGGRATELRNINANTPKDVVNKLSTMIDAHHKTLETISKAVPFFESPKKFGAQNCGIHVHLFHPGIDLISVLMAHNVVAFLVNLKQPKLWQSRMANGYGTLFNYRQQSAPWCGSNNATELRTLNTVHPTVLEFALELQDELLKNNRSKYSLERYSASLQKIGIGIQSVAHIQQMVGTISGEISDDRRQYFAGAIAGFIDCGIVKFNQVKKAVKWLDENYVAFDKSYNVINYGDKFMSFVLNKLRVFRPKRNGKQGQSRFFDQKDENGQKRYSWCERMNLLTSKRQQWHNSALESFRANFNTHCTLCEKCKGVMTALRADGFELVVRSSEDGTRVGIFSLDQIPA